MIEVKYKCGCQKAERSVYVQSRQPNQDAGLWMKLFVQEAISSDHRIVSPNCRSPTVEYAKIFIPDGVKGVGMAAPANG